ncbi:uncharacterized protein LOC106643201 [Copidosoma floridanum]|uniref:uncharacterized protein LOC106643201 n=1 Tax=Copidosoma floridanum TaxID=29053 RepID=UPI000C6F47FB|nr:uncharacterized protein LOC106643201 [Copidosoma floridanum]
MDDVLKGPYYARSRRYLILYGQWPYQDLGIVIFCQILMMLGTLSSFVPHCINVYEALDDFQYVVKGTPSLLFYVQLYAKNLFGFISRRKIKKVLDGIQRDFRVHAADELEVLDSYSRTASRFNYFYAACMFGVAWSFSTLPLVLHLMDVLVPLNETRLQQKPRPMTYHIGALDDNMPVIILHSYFADVLSMILIVGLDTLYLSLAYHACALFVIVAKRARGAIDRRGEGVGPSDGRSGDRDAHYPNCVKTVVAHQYALEFVGTIELAFSSLNLISIGCSVVPLAFVAFTVLVSKDSPDERIRYFLYAFAEVVHLFYYNWPGEKIREHSLLVYKVCYDGNWYEEEFGLKCQKLINLVMIRSQRPCIITAGKMYELGLKNFAAVVKVAMSYLTVLSSIM